jgi:hypothetical protein
VSNTTRPEPAPLPEDNPIMEVRFCWNCGAAISEFDRECCECGDCGFGLAVYPYAKQTKEYHALTRRLAEVAGELHWANKFAALDGPKIIEQGEKIHLVIARAEAAEARVVELEWLVEVQRVYALGIIDMGSESEYRACALDELSLSYTDALKCAGMWDETRQSAVGFAFNWSSACGKAALAAVGG